MNRPRSRRLRLASAVTMTLLASSTHATTFTWNSSSGGAMNVSTNWSPIGVPGTGDVVRFESLHHIASGLTYLVNANQSLARIEYDTFGQGVIEGSAVLTVPEIFTSNTIIESPGLTGTALTIRTPIAGGSGLLVQGGGFVALANVNTFTGTLNLVGDGTTGGIALDADSRMGSLFNPVSLSQSGTLRVMSSFSTTRAFSIGTGGGRVESFGFLNLAGNISGSGSFHHDRFTSGILTLSGTNALTGTTFLNHGSSTTLSGSLLQSPINLSGHLSLLSDSAVSATNHLGDSRSFTSNGGTLTINARDSNLDESTGALTLGGGMTSIHLLPTTTSGAAIDFASISRTTGTLFVNGNDLGNGAFASNRARVTFDNASGLGLIGAGGSTATNDSVIPFAFGISNPSVPDSAAPITNSSNGLRVLNDSDFETVIAGANDNVRISNTAYIQNSAATMNSLTLRSTSAGSSTGVSGSGSLTIASGVIVASGDSSSDSLSISNPVVFSATGYIHTGPTSDGHANLTLAGAVSGAAMVKSGFGDLVLSNTSNSFNGLTVNAGFVLVGHNVSASGTSVLGDGAITIDSASSGNRYAGLLASAANLTFSRAINVIQDSDSNSLATIGIDVAGNFAISGAISIGGGYLNLMGSSESGVLILSGTVSGAGGLQEPKIIEPYAQAIRLSGNNNFIGGTIIRAGTWSAASNTAFGSGTIWFEGNGLSDPIGSIVSFASARTLANPIVFRANPAFGGSIALTLNGSVDLGSVLREIEVTNTAGVTLGGAISDGGISKTGAGLLILSGNNTYTNQTQVREGILQIRSNSALGSSVGGSGQATYIIGDGILEFGSAVNTPERINFGADGLPITTTSSTGNLRARTGTSTISNDIGLDNIGTIGVDSGATLNIDGDLIDLTDAENATLRKVGTGLLTITRARISNVSINAGTLRVRSGSGFEGTSNVESLTIASGTLDLTDNAWIINYTSSPLATIFSYLTNSRIISSMGSGWTVGYAEADALFDEFPNQFHGQDIDQSSLLLLGTYGGDTDLDGDVDFSDLLKVAQNYDTTGYWTEGDFNYDNDIDFTDLLLVAQNYGLGTIDGPIGTDQFAFDWQSARTQVPEPTILLLFGIGLIGMRRHARIDRGKSLQ